MSICSFGGGVVVASVRSDVGYCVGEALEQLSSLFSTV